MAKNDVVVVRGTVVDCLPNANFKVQVKEAENSGLPLLTCHLSGRMRQKNIRVLLGDEVDVEVSMYDPSKGRISYRHK